MKKSIILIIVITIIILTIILYNLNIVYIARKGRIIHTDEYIEIQSPYPIHVYHDKYSDLRNNKGGASLNYKIYCDGRPLQPIHSKSPFFTYEVELNKIITMVIKLHNSNNFTVWVFLYLGWEYGEYDDYYLNDSIDIKLVHFPRPKVMSFIEQPTNIIHDFNPNLIKLEPNETKILRYHIKIIKAGKNGFYPIEIMDFNFMMIDGELWNFDMGGTPLAFQIKKS